MDGGGGLDLIVGGTGNDEINGGNDGDVVYAGAGEDQVLGGQGPDQLFGQDGTDRLFGGAGEDRIYASLGADFVDAGSDNDTIIADGDGINVLAGGGNDLVSASGRPNHGRGRRRQRPDPHGLRAATTCTEGRAATRSPPGAGNDRIEALDGRRDRVHCGGGRRDCGRARPRGHPDRLRDRIEPRPWRPSDSPLR